MGPTWLDSHLLHADCFLRAGVNTDPAIDAGFLIDYRLFVNHLDRLAWTLWDTSFATSAFLFIYFSWHLHYPFKRKKHIAVVLKPQSLIRHGMLQNYYDITTYFSKKFYKAFPASTPIPLDRFKSGFFTLQRPFIIVLGAPTDPCPRQLPYREPSCLGHFLQSSPEPDWIGCPELWSADK